MRSLVRGKRPLYGTMEMFGLIEASNLAQARTLGFQTLLDFRIAFNLDEILPPAVIEVGNLLNEQIGGEAVTANGAQLYGDEGVKRDEISLCSKVLDNHIRNSTEG